MPWPCFWVERNGEAAIWLRRYSSTKDDGDACPSSPYRRYHNADAFVEYRPLVETDEHYVAAVHDDDWRVSHPDAWPTKCAWCDYVFAEDDEWQANQEAIYVRPDTGETWGQRNLPIGALFDGFWSTFGVGPDGISLFCVLPPHKEPWDARSNIWHVDGGATNGPRENAWTRTGDPRAIPPTVDANPSIAAPGYHGYLRHGVLTDPV